MALKIRRSIILGILAASAAASALADDPPNSKRKLLFTINYVTAGASSINHVVKGQCDLLVGAPSKYGVDKPTKAQSAEDSRKSNEAGAPIADFQGEMQKCGRDIGCMSALAQKMQQSGAIAKSASLGKAAVAQEPNFVGWGSTICSNITMTVNDRIVSHGTDSGEGGERAYTSTRTIQGSATVDQMPQGVSLQHNLKTQSTEYRFSQPLSPSFDFTEVATGGNTGTSRGKDRVQVFPAVPMPSLAGPPKSGRAVKPVPGGSVTFDWTIVR